jgi:2'-hydroxyisoflavone reductase
MAIDKNWQGLGASIGKLYTHESSTMVTWFVPTSLTQVGGAKGWQVTLFNRGKTDPARFAGDAFKDIVQLKGDRDPAKGDGLKSLEALVASMRKEGTRFDAVIDNSSYFPRITTASAELLAPVAGMDLAAIAA